MSEYAVYRQGWQEREERQRREWAALADEARALAGRLAHLLVNEFDATQVYLHGSLTRKGRFHHHSDIDLAVRGIKPIRVLRPVRPSAGRLIAVSGSI